MPHDVGSDVESVSMKIAYLEDRFRAESIDGMTLIRAVSVSMSPPPLLFVIRRGGGEAVGAIDPARLCRKIFFANGAPAHLSGGSLG